MPFGLGIRIFNTVYMEVQKNILKCVFCIVELHYLSLA
jgi:hypothetical protein